MNNINMSKEKLKKIIAMHKSNDITDEKVLNSLNDEKIWDKIYTKLGNYLNDVSNVKRTDDPEKFYEYAEYIMEPELNDPLLQSIWYVFTEAVDTSTFVNIVKSLDPRFEWVAEKVKKEGY